MMSGLRGDEAPKIVQIETRYVQTDAVNFRDVVQSLTGKNSSTAWIGRKNAAHGSSEIINKGGIGKTHELGAANSHGTKETLLPSSMPFNNNVSFKDFDALSLELPPIEVMPWFYS